MAQHSSLRTLAIFSVDCVGAQLCLGDSILAQVVCSLDIKEKIQKHKFCGYKQCTHTIKGYVGCEFARPLSKAGLVMQRLVHIPLVYRWCLSMGAKQGDHVGSGSEKNVQRT